MKRRGKTPRISGGLESTADMPRRRRQVFQAVMILLPFLLLGLVEVVLRLAGYGYPARYFLKATNDAGPVLVANFDFTRRFFPPGLERTPLPVALRPGKAPGSVRIFIFGESAAMGDPEPAFGFGRVLEVLLEGRHPGRSFEVVNVSTTAINSHVLREIARDCGSLEGDFWILYVGNNEVVGPYGAGTIFSGQAPPLGMIRASLTLKATRLGQALEGLRVWAMSSGTGITREWEGMEMFLDRQISANHPSMERVYEHFQSNLEALIAMGRKSGAHVILSTVVANLKDCAPFASSSVTPEAERVLQQARLQFEEGNPGAALGLLQQETSQFPGSADYHYLLGLCELALENQEEARRRFLEARDLDTLRFRVDSRMNQIIRQTAVRMDSEPITLVDAVEVLERQYPHRIVGGEYLYEHVHFNHEGNYLIARTLAEAVENRMTADPGQREWRTADDCADLLGYTDWARLEVGREMLRRLEQAPFEGQYGNDRRKEALERELGGLRGAMTVESMEAMRTVYQRALERAPEDWVLREQFGLFLRDMGRLEESLEQWRAVVARVPNHYQARYHLANALDGLGRSDEAIPEFRKVFKEHPASPETLNGLALALDAEGASDEAMEILRNAVEARPGFVEARINLGQMLARLGKVEEAKAQYEEALKLRTNSVGAHVNLGKLLAAEGQGAQAEAHYRAAITESPDNAVAHYNLGNLLSARRDPEAGKHFETAVRADPRFAAARVNWGLELAGKGLDAEATEQFQAAVGLNPGLDIAQLNLGVSLARQGRFAEAIPHFEAALRLDPDSEAARDFLEKAKAMVQP